MKTNKVIDADGKFSLRTIFCSLYVWW